MENQPPARESVKDNSFEAQFAHRETFLINGAKVESVDINPENPKSEIPVLLAPGFASTMEGFKHGMRILAENNRRVISLNHPRTGGVVPESFNEEIDKNPTEELRKAHNLLGLIDEKKIERVDVVAHSEGAINTCIAAMINPEKFRNIVLYGPAGLIGADSLLRLVFGVVTHPKRPETMSGFPVTDLEKEINNAIGKEGLIYQISNPLRAAKEVLAIAQAQIEDTLVYLREKGVHVVVIAAVDDTFFPMEKYQKNIDSSFVDGFLSVRGGHMEIQTQPELYMGAAESMITALEEKMQKEKVKQKIE